MPLDPVQIREAFHVLVLRAIAPGLGAALRLKGVVNLRLFYGSERYSEDMDLDADARFSERLKRLLVQSIRVPQFRRELLALGIADVEMNNHPAKNTDTVLRYKMGLIAGGVRYPTKIEVSYRGEAPREWACVARPPEDVTRPYVAPGTTFPELGHYGRNAAAWQKILALAQRTLVQARDVFDLGVLLAPRLDAVYGPVDRRFLRAHLTDELLQEAERRALDFSHGEFRDQVAAFLPPQSHARSTAQWERTQVDVASFVGQIRCRSLAPDQAPELPRYRGESGE